MPAILEERRPKMRENPMNATEVGDLAYIFAMFYYTRWLKNPRWSTYHYFRKLLEKWSLDEEFSSLCSKLSLSTHFDVLDVKVAAREALREFYRKVMTKYEDAKYEQNGEVFVEPVQAK